MRRALVSDGAPSRFDRGGVPAAGCMVALMVPIVLVLLAVGTLMVMSHRQNSANERKEHEALERTARLVESYEDDVWAEARNGYPSQAQTRAIARRNHGTLVSYEPSNRSLTTVVEFFATYEDISFFGTSESHAYRCYSLRFQDGVDGGPRRTKLPLSQCNPP
ncbi:hypothetical protein ACH4NV_17285 [Streptomyces althioticus]|uniref:hypothetical protein n=2 Tax=Streptomyces althioticus TaxID=83380 RepID=UPI0037BBD74B